VGPNFKIPAPAGEGEGGVISAVYTDLDHSIRGRLLGCCVGMAKCLLKENQVELARNLIVLPALVIDFDCRLSRGWKRPAQFTAVLTFLPSTHSTASLPLNRVFSEAHRNF
jgi:hypothetical protein